MSQRQSQSVVQQWQVTVPLSTGPVQSALLIQVVVIMVTSSRMGSTACIPGLGDFPFPPGGLAVLLWRTLGLPIPGDGSLGGPMA